MASLGAYCCAAAFVAASWLAAGSVASAADTTPYQVIDGRVDRQTYNGYRRYNAACNHCHGPDGAGSSFGPSLIESPPEYDAFAAAVLYGRANGLSVMKGFAEDPNVVPYLRDIYSYLRARSDAAIGRGRPLLDER